MATVVSELRGNLLDVRRKYGNQINHNNDEINKLEEKIKELKWKNSQEESSAVRDFNNEYLNTANQLLEKSSGHTVGMNFVDDINNQLEVLKLERQVGDDGNSFYEEVSQNVRAFSKKEILSVLKEIVDTTYLYDSFDMASRAFLSDMNQRVKESNRDKRNLSKKYNFINDSKEFEQKSRDLIGEINTASRVFSSRVPVIEDGLASIVLDICKIPEFGFERNRDVYLNSDNDVYSFIIDNSNGVLPRGVIRNAGEKRNKNSDLIYLGIDKNMAEDFSYDIKKISKRKAGSSGLTDIVNDFLNEHGKILATISAISGSTTSAGTLIYQWANSWINQVPVENPENVIYMGLGVAGVLSSLYLGAKGISSGKEKVGEFREKLFTKNALSNIIKNSEYITNPRVIAEELVSNYHKI